MLHVMQNEFTFTVSPDDHKEAQRIHLRPRPIFKVLLYIILALVAVAFVFSIADGDFFNSDTLIMGGFGIYLYVAYRFIFPRKWLKVYRENKILQKEQNFRFDNEGIHAHSENGTGMVAWKDLLKWKEGKETLLIYPASNLFYIIPKSIFHNDNELLSIKELLVQNLGNQKA